MTDKQYFMRTLGYVKPYKIPYAIGMFLYSSQSFLFPLLTSVAFGGIMAAIIAENFSGVLNSVYLMMAIMLGGTIFVGIGAYLYVVTSGKSTRDLSTELFSAFMKTGIESQKHSGEGVAAINTDIDTATNIFSDALAPFLRNIIGASFSIVSIFVIDWRMGFGAVGVGLLGFLIQSRFAAPLARLGKEQLETNADTVKSLSNILAGALTIRTYSRQERALVQFDRESGKLRFLGFRQAFLSMWQSLFTTVQGWITLVFIFALGGWLIATGQAEFPMLMMVMPFATAISNAMSEVGADYAGLQPPIVAAKRIFDIIDAAEGTASGKMSFEKGEGSDGKYCINISDLNFSYKGASEDTLKNINLKIEENEMVAFVGMSGSGKSTLLRAIIGMYDRSTLNMEVGGMSFSTEKINNWRDNFAYVDQSCKLFNMTISENIAMGKQGAVSEPDIEKAAKRAFAHDFIMEQAEGYDSPCGEKGGSLSGGQKQRLAIARALYRKAPVLVFDEATSALDAESERSIMETIESLRGDHTILITTHNLSNIATADKIVVMDDGRIAEIGTHEELAGKDGVYSTLLAQK